ncbi:hypothetical protein [Saccharothrix variisporea]|uniref:Uncharacterized protein n=1 Tax=Saccharothrix variisporea TaxID=543527 RepID=A0A495X1Q1_9PSEU|nr:hypothetical protein [Saccharothrix variisporea]RKT67124.1 hypothetical protein DFJ66_0292 [Saccharothrix variisporea]
MSTYFTAHSKARRDEAMSCFEHYRAAVRLIDSPDVVAGLSGVDRADIYLAQLQAAGNETVYETTLNMISSHYGISWQAIRRSGSVE